MVSHWLSVCLSVCLSVFSFPDDTMSKCQWIFTKLYMCIDIVEIWLGLLMGKCLSALDTSVFSFPDFNFSKYQWISTKLGVCIDIVKICFGIVEGQISSFLYPAIQ